MTSSGKKILVVGGGGREHAIVRKLRESAGVAELYAAPGNGGISADAVCVDLKANDVAGVVDYAVQNHMDFVVVAPEDPLALGMVDALAEKGVRAFGPTAAAARIEGSKVFSKELMERYGIPTAKHKSFSDKRAALDYIRSENRFPVVVKADGLALGKGVVIPEDLNAAEQALTEMMEDQVFGDSGARVVVEEFLTGPEVTVLAFVDGETVVPMVSSMDHKRAFDGNRGPNTGGMGTIAPNPHYTAAVAKTCMDTIFLPTVRALAAEGCPFKGCLYFGLMLTGQGPKVIEYNCRFGDPETQVVLSLLETDLLEIMEAVCDGSLSRVQVRWRDGAAACVAIASGGYPGKYETGLPIKGLDSDGQTQGAVVYHAGTKRVGDGFVTAGGRVLGVTAAADTLGEALHSAYRAAERIRFAGAHMRRDIGSY